LTYRAILFDLFDTLLYMTPTDNRARAVALLAAHGISEEDWWRGWREGFAPAVRGQTADLEERVALTLQEAGAPPLPPAIMASLVSLLRTRNTPTLYDDVPAAMAELRARGYRMGLLSNLTSEEKQVLDPFDLRGLFDVTVASCEVGLAKPEPGIYHLAAQRLGVRPEECVFVDDQPPYLTGAMAVGMCGVLIQRFNAHDWEGVRDIECALRIAELSDLLAWLPARVDG
jgi:putative hydrolase of the HAD superfamily